MGSNERAGSLREERNRLVEAELSALRRYARALAPDADVANDLVQETIVRAIAHWEQWRQDAPLKSWLFAIMRNTHFRAERRTTRWRSISADLARRAESRTAPTPTDPLLVRRLGAALGELSEGQREILFLVVVEGLTYAEVAELTETPIGTVMSRLSRARARLRERTQGL